jgi:hypothetical protein
MNRSTKLLIAGGSVLLAALAFSQMSFGQLGPSLCKIAARATHQKCLEECDSGFWALIPLIRDNVVDSCERSCDRGLEKNLKVCGGERQAVTPIEPGE